MSQPTKHSKHPHYDDPSAFSKKWPPIVEVRDKYSPLEKLGGTARYYRLGQTNIVVREPDGEQGWFMTISRRNHYPSWDEVVWARYNLIPDAAHMVLALPNLNSYINREDDATHRNTFTLAQRGWHLDPTPTCPECGAVLALLDDATRTASSGTFTCLEHPVAAIAVDFNVWNEQHGNGLGAIAVKQEGQVDER